MISTARGLPTLHTKTTVPPRHSPSSSPPASVKSAITKGKSKPRLQATTVAPNPPYGAASLEFELATARTKLERRLDSAQPPLAIRHFVLGPWARVCAHEASTRPADATAPSDAMDVAIDLIWSTDAARSRLDSPTMTAILPGLVKRLAAGLVALGLSSEQRKAWLNQLAGLHMTAMRRAIGASSDSGPITVDLELDGELSSRVEFDMTLSGHECTPSSVEPDAECPALLRQLKVGDTFDMQLQGSGVAMRLLWISDNGEFLFFTSAHGGGSHSFTRRTLMKMHREGLMHPITAAGGVVPGAGSMA